MAIAFVNNFHGSSSGVGGSITVPAGGVDVGNLLVLAVIGADTGTNDLVSVSDSDGVNTYNIVAFPNAKGNPSNIGTLNAAWCIVTDTIEAGDAISPVISVPANGWQAICAVFSGIASSPFDQVNNSQTAFNTTHVSSAITTTQADELLIGSNFGATATTWVDDGTALWTIIEQYDPFPAFAQVLQYRTVSATGSYSSSINSTVAKATQDQIMSFKASSGPPPTANVPRYQIRRSRGTSW